jgi:hypothetical protein
VQENNSEGHATGSAPHGLFKLFKAKFSSRRDSVDHAT